MMENNTDYIYLSNEKRFELGVNQFGGNSNTVVIGDTGSGKTFSTVLPTLLHMNNHSVVVTLSKKKLATKLRGSFKKKGYKVKILNLASPKDSEIGYDLLNKVKTEKDILFIAKSLLGEARSGEDAYWNSTAVSVLAAEIAYVIQKAKRKEAIPSFSEVIELHNQLIVTESVNDRVVTSLDAYFACEERISPGNYASKCWKTIQGLPAKTLTCVLSTLNTALDKIFISEVMGIIKHRNPLDIPMISEEKTALFIITSAMNPSLNAFINLFYSDLFKQLFEYSEESCENGKLHIPVHVVCDDFACGAKIPNFAEYISIFREKGISATILLQSESQLSTIYSPYEAQTILNNCANHVFFGSMDVKSCQTIGTIMNKPLDEIMFMPLDNVIVLRRGERPEFGKRYRTLEDELYKKVFEKEYESYER